MSLFNAKLPSLKDRHRAMLEPDVPSMIGADDSEGANKTKQKALPAKKAKVGRKLKVK